MAIPFAASLTPQTARKAPSRRVAAKSGACCVSLLGFVGRATTFVARLAVIPILPATHSTEDLFSGSLKSRFRHNTLLLTKNVSLHIDHMLRLHFLFPSRLV